MGMKISLLVLSFLAGSSLFGMTGKGLPASIAELDSNKNAKIDAEEVQLAIEAYIYGDPRFNEKRIDEIIEYYFAQFEAPQSKK